jgi:dihydrofolate synthase/folylpolyglutamate synthase
VGQRVTHLLDVAHNPDAAAALARHLAATRSSGRSLLVIGVLVDKDAPGIMQALAAEVDEVHAAGLPGARGQSGESLAARIRGVLSGRPLHAHADVATAHAAALRAARAGDRIVVCGSFLTVGAVRARGVYSAAS